MLHLAVLGCLLTGYLAFSILHLDTVPRVFEDEPWQASTAWKLAQEGAFGSDMFAGYYDMERHYYGFMPLHPMLQAALFRFAGLGVFQARLETVLVGLLTLLLTYLLGRRLFGPSVGLLAVALLLGVRLVGQTSINPTGILLIDAARIARYDAVVPVFGLASLHAYISGRQRSNTRMLALAGVLAALAGLSHVYGAFWIVALGVLALWNHVGTRGFVALAIGFVVPWLPYAAYVLHDVSDWVGQTRIYGPRFGLLDPGWYWDNLRNEHRRYGPGLGPNWWDYLLRPGFWTALIVVPTSLLALAFRAIRRNDRAAQGIVAPAALIPLLFALLIYMKQATYLVSIIPVAAVIGAWGAVSLWRWSSSYRRKVSVRVGLIAVGLAVAFEGATELASLQASASFTTPYDTYIARVRLHVPPGSTVLGSHAYWFGFDDHDYRAWIVPALQADPRYSTPALPMAEALDRIAPDVILVDARTRTYLDTSATTGRAARDWLVRRGYVRVTTVDDPTYGPMEVYWLKLGAQTIDDAPARPQER